MSAERSRDGSQKLKSHSSGYLPSGEEVKMLWRRVSGGLSMAQTADIACQKEIDNLTLCRGMNAAGANKNACASQEDAVLECRGSFLCPAVQEKFMECMKAKAAGRTHVICDNEKASLRECVVYYQNRDAPPATR